MPGTTFLWTSEPAEIERKLDGTPVAVVLRVQRPMFGSYSKVEDWQMKPIQAFKGCDVEPNPATCSGLVLKQHECMSNCFLTKHLWPRPP